ncbi:MAG: hypothetical protein WCC48_19215, partial [Anaeromyxobacteraceae bacterium]
WWGAWVGGLAATMVVAGLGVGALRHRVEIIGPSLFFQPSVSPRKLASPFFSRLEASPILVDVEGELARLLAAAAPHRPWFGPRMQWAYAAFQVPSPSGQPPWWHPGVTYPPLKSAEALLVHRWIDADYDLVVFLKQDTTYMPAALLDAIARGYEERPGFGTLTVWVPRRAR